MNQQKYSIVEAIAEFHIDPNLWQSSIADEFYGHIKERFPERKTINVRSANFEFKPDASKQSVEEHKRHQFVSKDKCYIVQIDDGLVTVNNIAPYSCWEEYLPLIIKMHDVIKKIRPGMPIDKYALHYLNRIEIKAAKVIRIEDYLVFLPPMRESDSFLSCSCAINLFFQDIDTELIKVMQVNPHVNQIVPVFLNLVAISKTEYQTDIKDWFCKVHELLTKEYKESITEKTLNLYKEN